MSTFNERDHPRDKSGQFTEKGYDSRNDFGQTVDRAQRTYRQNAGYSQILAADRAEREREEKREKAERIYSDDAPCTKSKPNYGKLKGKIQSKVYDKISSVRKDLKRDGYVYINVNDFYRQYYVKLYDSEYDYEFEIIRISKIMQVHYDGRRIHSVLKRFCTQ